MSAHRIQRSRAKGWRMPENTVCVTRPGKWGNPFEIAEERTPAEAVFQFNEALEAGKLSFTIADVRRELKDKNLACWCRPGSPCHAETLLRIANREPLAIELLTRAANPQPKAIDP
jgi:hypothetical protein